MNHTPLPWRIYEDHDLPAGKGIFIGVPDIEKISLYLPIARITEFSYQKEITEANTKFIIKACNSYYDLLEACKAAATLIVENYKNKDDLWGIYSQLIRAIQKAEGNNE